MKIKAFVRVALLLTFMVSFISCETVAAEMPFENKNRLADNFSPYLRQHANNPIDWYPWGEEALKRAKQEDKPIFVSIGYSTCYWCHVLEREVFSQEDTADIMNKNFINVKIDREVRPDLDEIFMAATQFMTKGGGWPNNLMLTPDLKPFFAVTYLPKDEWMGMLGDATDAWNNKRKSVEKRADLVASTVKSQLSGSILIESSLPIKRLAEQFYEGKKNSYDSRHGGFGSGAKFPQETDLLFLLDYAQRNENTEPLGIVQNTVDHMISGGIHDHVGGGFHRYTTDAKWQIPHFEKMLYNQGLMAVLLVRLYEQTKDLDYKHAMTRLLDYVAREMTDESGAFYSAQDAETDAVEGAYYVWKKEELKKVLGQSDYDFLTSFYKTEKLPDFEGRKSSDGEVLYRVHKMSEDEQSKSDQIFSKLLVEREKRQAPSRDTKIIAAWNGVMIYGLVEAGRVLENAVYIERAEKAAAFILNNMKQENGGLYRISIDGKPYQHAFFEDYAWMTRGLLALYAATDNDQYKEEAIKIIKISDRLFLDKESGGYFMADGSDDLFTRVKIGADAGSLPSDNAVMAHNFLALYEQTQEQEWKNRMDAIAGSFSEDMLNQPFAYGYMLNALMQTERDNKDLIIEKVPERIQPYAQGQDISIKSAVETENKITVKAYINSDESKPTRKTVKTILNIEKGWHVNANSVGLEFLVPTVVDIQTDEESSVDVRYPPSTKKETPIGKINIYENTVDVISVVTADKDIDVSKMRILVQVQACKDEICYPPSQISIQPELLD